MYQETEINSPRSTGPLHCHTILDGRKFKHYFERFHITSEYDICIHVEMNKQYLICYLTVLCISKNDTLLGHLDLCDLTFNIPLSVVFKTECCFQAFFHLIAVFLNNYN